MKIELDLKKIGQIAKQKSAENISFQTYLKGQNAIRIDEIVHRLYKEFTIKISCVDCGNCCQNLRPIASYKELSKFVEDKDIEAFMYLESISCKFHKDKKCTDYSNRPEECRSYPNLDEDQFITKTYGALRNYEICPIVFNVFEALKVELDWDYQLRMNTKK
ncbi:YkgJ family cysteine cluster protein [Labilibaculum filiforme]|nr:YkgJ family cysteine cluster protein [Labilibaculum filiforme]